MSSFALKGDWKRFSKLVDKERFKGTLARAVAIETEKNALLGVRHMRQQIKKQAFGANAALTILIKRSSKALVDDGDLFAAITYKMISGHEAIIGVMKGTRDSAGQEITTIAQILHEGSTLAVTPAMRGLFFYLWLAGLKEIPVSTLTGRAHELAAQLKGGLKDIRPLGQNTRQIVVPPRPFVRHTMKDLALQKRWKSNWERAVQSALKV